MDIGELIERIVEIAGDYRRGEIAKFNAKHVERWINQFAVDDSYKNVILLEVGHMLEKYYISRDKAKEHLHTIFKAIKKEHVGGCSIRDVTFLRTQGAGKSQHEMLIVADELLDEKIGISTKDCGGSKVYLYIDDCIYSGNKWRYDIANSAQLKNAGKGVLLVSFHFNIYSAGYAYAKPCVDSTMLERGGIVKPFRIDAMNNARFGKEKLDVMWPSYVKGNKQIDEYAQHTQAFSRSKGWGNQVLFRTIENAQSNVFTSVTNRNIVEQAFLAVGAKLFCAATNPAPSVRPMGFEKLSTIGFGTPIVTWRNIANNAPLALWYGDPSYGPTHPLGMWYPLFPRKI